MCSAARVGCKVEQARNNSLRCRAQVSLQFVCQVAPSGKKRATAYIRLSADEIVARGSGGVLLAYVRTLRSDGVVPRRGSVSDLIAGPPCQGLSSANRWRKRTDIMGAEQVRLAVRPFMLC